MKTRMSIRCTLHRIGAFFLPYRGYKRPKLKTFPGGVSYIAAGAFPIRQATRER